MIVFILVDLSIRSMIHLTAFMHVHMSVCASRKERLAGLAEGTRMHGADWTAPTAPAGAP